LRGIPPDQLTNQQRQAKVDTDQHIKVWHKQSCSYKDKKQKIGSGELGTEILVIHDFTQIQVQGTFFQDLIICFYEHSAPAKDGLKRTYLHFVAPTSQTKNDFSFVCAVWKKLISDGYFAGKTKLVIYSDGGPKHFKITANMTFFAAVQTKLGIPVEYNFFEANHGHSVCDGVAAQAKKKLNQHQRDQEEIISTPIQIADIVTGLENHIGLVAPTLVENLDKFPTFTGIRSCFKFAFDEQNVYGFPLTESVQHSHIWKRGNFAFF